jgi:predicted nucleic acid-binding protein
MILVDTGPLVAICDRGEMRHATAIEVLVRLVTTGLRVCDAVLTEACFHLSHKVQRERLALVLDKFAILSLPTHEPAFRQEVFRWLDKYAEHDPDWADGCLAVWCGRDVRLKVWTYDREFRTTWRKPDGKAIPLTTKA